MFGCSDDGDSGSNEPCPSQPSLQTNPATQVESDELTDTVSVTLNGEIINNPIGANCETLSISSQGFVYAIHTQPTIDDIVHNVTGQNINYNISGLDYEETYYVRTYLTGPNGTYYGNEISFNTPESPNDLIFPTSMTREYISGWSAGLTREYQFVYSGSKVISQSRTRPFYPTGIQHWTHIYSGGLRVSTYETGLYDDWTDGNYSYETLFEYNDDGLLIEEKQLNENGDEMWVYNYSYTNNNLTRQKISADGQLITVINYGSDSNIIETLHYNSGVLTNIITHTYDDKNNIYKNVTGNPHNPFQGANNEISSYSSLNDCSIYWEHIYNDYDYPETTTFITCDTSTSIFTYYYN